MANAQATITNDHKAIRRWAEERGAKPACVRGTGGDGDIGMLRLDFPGYSGQDSLEHISWDEWFDKFDERGLALLHQDKTARGQKSNFNKLISRETAQAPKRGKSAAGRRTVKAVSGRESIGSKSSAARASNKTAARATRGSTRAKRTESARGRTTSRRKAA